MLYFCNRIETETMFSIKWSVRLGVRTQGFHPCNRGSIPLRTTILSYTFEVRSSRG